MSNVEKKYEDIPTKATVESERRKVRRILTLLVPKRRGVEYTQVHETCKIKDKD